MKQLLFDNKFQRKKTSYDEDYMPRDLTTEDTVDIRFSSVEDDCQQQKARASFLSSVHFTSYDKVTKTTPRQESSSRIP